MSLAHPEYDIEGWRRTIPLLASHIPMNNCSQAPQTDATRAAAERYLESWNTSGMDWDTWMAEVALAKAEFAKLIGATADDIAVFSSVSEAASAVASALNLAGDRTKLVVSEAEFPTVAQVWLAQERRGACLSYAPVRDGTIDPASYDELIDERTALVSSCHGYYMNGFVQDVARIAARARDAGALSFVDAYQTLGTMVMDVRAAGMDFLVAGNLKFLMGIPGIAFLYVRPGIVGTLHPTVTGWFGRANPFAFDAKSLDWSPTASRFDTGTPPVINAYVARAGMEIINAVGPAKIRAWLEVLGRRLIDGGRARGFRLHGTDDTHCKTATTAFVVRDSHAVEDAMRARGVIASARGSVIRLAPHFYNTIDDIDFALDALARVERAG
ncbi:MAG TPA: aminotransferase class V-fold PLP-dependent enzyme [Gemmatimonadaceae bacterium]|nr:aminotransferase class V-fold PLP-dependent enzyme [Gemmatimonadaceae bacterium]